MELLGQEPSGFCRQGNSEPAYEEKEEVSLRKLELMGSVVGKARI